MERGELVRGQTKSLIQMTEYKGYDGMALLHIRFDDGSRLLQGVWSW